MYTDLSAKYLKKAYKIILVFVILYILDFCLPWIFTPEKTYQVHFVIFTLTILLTAVLIISLASDRFGLLNDLRKHQKTELELREKNTFINKILGLSPDQIYVLDIVNRKNLFLNRSLEGLQFQENGELDSFLSLIHPDDLPKVQEHFIKIAEGKDNIFYSLEYRLKFENNYKWFLSRDIIFKRNDQGKVEQIIGIATDITYLKETEIELAEAQERFKLAFYTSPDAVAVTKPDGVYIDVNEGFLNITGFSREEIIGNNSVQMNTWVVPELRVWYFNEILVNGKMMNVEAQFRMKDGSLKTGLISSSLIRLKGEPAVISVIRDITERKMAAEALMKKTEELDNHFNYSLDLLCITDLKGTMIRFNPEWVSVLGYSEDELRASNSIDFVHPDDLENTFVNIKRLRNHQMVENFQNRYRRKDGTYRWLEWRAIPKGDLVYSYARDITEAKEAKDKLVKSERALKNLIGNLPGFVYRCKNDENWTMEFISESIFDITGFTPDDFMSGKIRFPVIIHEVDILKVRDTIQNKINQREVYELEYRVYTQKSELRWVWERGRGIYEGLEAVFLEGFVSDITVRKQFEEALLASEIKHRTLVENMNDGLIMRNANGKVLYSNDKALSILGISPEELKYIGGGRLAKEDMKFLNVEITRMLRGEIDSVCSEFRIQRGDGQEAWIEIRVNPVKGEYNFIVGSQSLFRDITDRVIAFRELENHRLNLEKLVGERTKELAEINALLQKEIMKQKEAEQQIIKTLEKEKELSGLKSRFINMASHEFRTPLATMYSSADLIRMLMGDSLDNRIEIQLRKIQKNINYLTEVTDEVLVISRAEAGKLTIEPAHVNSKIFFDGIVESAKQLCSDKHTLDVSITDELPFMFMDPKVIRIALLNILANAVKYSPEGGKVEFKAIKNNRELIITISDSGIGIPEDDSRHLFIPFHRAGNVGSIRGTGLGLSISLKYIELHKGSISFQNNVPAGTVFTVILPIKELNDEQNTSD